MSSTERAGASGLIRLMKASMAEANLDPAVGAVRWESVVGSMTIQRLVSQSCVRAGNLCWCCKSVV